MHNSSRDYRSIRPEVAELLPDHYSKVLEIGCAEGRFATNLKHRCEYWGIEPVQRVAEIASQTLHKVLMGTYQEAYDNLPDSYFDLVICNDVIEHMSNHNVFFQTIKQKMQDNSYIVGSIPNVRYIGNLYELLIKKDWMYKDEGILDKTHLRFFTEKSLQRTIIENNFVIEEFHGINSAIIKTKLVKRIMTNVLICLIVLCSLGFYSDVQFRQFGFRIKHSNVSNN